MLNLSISLFGAFQATIDGEVVSNFKSDKVRALLAYLAEEGDQPHRREKLAGLLWAELPERAARDNLRDILANLRSAIGDREAVPPFLTISRQNIQFNTTSHQWVDTREFKALLKINTGSPNYITHLEKAVELHCGSFLEGFSLAGCPEYEEWLRLKQAHYSTQLLKSLERLAFLCQKHGAIDSALRHARRRVIVDPLQEEAHRQVMELLILNGQRNEALAQYKICHSVLAQELAVPPTAETTALYEQIHNRGLPGGIRRQQPHANWGLAPDISDFHGRHVELTRLRAWILAEKHQVVGIFGIGGIGKTALATKLAMLVHEQFAYVFWRSLRNAPPVEEVIRECIEFFSDGQVYDLPTDIDKRLPILIDHLRTNRCLLILDNVEAILQAGKLAGQYRPGYEGYGALLQATGQTRHQSCLILTSREKPKEFIFLESPKSKTRSLSLSSLHIDTGRTLLQDQGLKGTDELWYTLINRYSGNPLALKVVSETIRTLFDGEIAAFLQANGTIWGDIWELLNQQFIRLSSLEQELMIWLTIEREAISLEALRNNLVQPSSVGELIEAFNALERRSLLEKTRVGKTISFTLQNVVMEYVADYFIEQVCSEVVGGKLALFRAHALLKAQAKDYVRESQLRLILKPIAERLLVQLETEGVLARLADIISALRKEHRHATGYAGGNAINLLQHFKGNLSGYDFSNLAIRQAYLRDTCLHNTNFSEAILRNTIFADTFGAIFSVAYSPNGQFIAAGTDSGEIRVWRTFDNELWRILEGHKDAVRSITFRTNSQNLLSGADDGTLCLWDLQTGRCLHILDDHTDAIECVSFSPLNTIAASSSNDLTIRLWDIDTGQCLKILRGHIDAVMAICFTPDGTQLVSSSDDSTIAVWNIQSGQCTRKLEGHSGGVVTVCCAPDGTLLASGGSDDRTIRLWNIDTGECLQILHGHTAQVRIVRFSPNGKILASGSFDQTVRLWDVEKLKDREESLRTLTGHTDMVLSLDFSPDGNTLITGSYDHSIRLWDVDAGQCVRTHKGHIGEIVSISYHSSSRFLASGGYDHTVRLWHTPQFASAFSSVFPSASPPTSIGVVTESYTLLGHTGRVATVCFQPNGDLLASGGSDQTVRLWDTNTQKSIRVLTGHTDRVTVLCFHPDGNLFASGSGDHTIRLWGIVQSSTLATTTPIDGDDCLHILCGHTDWILTICFSPDGRYLVSGAADGTIRLWHVETGQCIKTLKEQVGWMGSLCFSPDYRTLVCGCFDHTIRLWDVNETALSALKASPTLDSVPYLSEKSETLRGHTNIVLAVCYSPHGGILASSSVDQTIRLWDMETAECVHILRGHAGAIWSVNFSPDGNVLASGSVDETIRFWDVHSGTCLATVRAKRPYEGMDISGVMGISEAQVMRLKRLGAADN